MIGETIPAQPVFTSRVDVVSQSNHHTALNIKDLHPNAAVLIEREDHGGGLGEGVGVRESACIKAGLDNLEGHSILGVTGGE